MKSLAAPSLEPATSCPPRRQLPTAEWSLVDWYLEQQGQLTAVEEFCRVQPRLSASTYRTLLPAQPPGPGEQYAFEVDLDRCSGCKACVTACHSLNGLDDAETWRDVGLLTGGHDQAPFQQHVTAACHHCLEPACLDVCPTLAYEKDSATGIVQHLDDQCFGCQYCILACPYNVPRFNPRLGIVRKCDLCSQRLSVGESPACVQACPHEAIRIQVVSVEQVQADAETSQFLPGAPDPQYTLPTTNYKTNRPLPRNLMPADYYRVQVEHAHGPLVAMLVLTQMSVGGFALPWLSERVGDVDVPAAFRAWQFAFSLAVCCVALTASLLHLGRPWLAYRAVLGLKTSWLSREILAFGLFAAAAACLTLQTLWPAGAAWTRVPSSAAELGTVLTGLCGVFCSAMIYHRTKRPFWNLYQSGTRFVLTTILLGLAAAWASAAVVSASDPLRSQIPTAILAVSLVKGIWELGALAPLLDRPQTALKRSALLLVGPLRTSFCCRFALLTAAGIVVPGWLLLQSPESVGRPTELCLAAVGLLGLTGGELLERSLFFKASVAFRMPGGTAT